MPIYDFTCERCGSTFERTKSIAKRDDLDEQCSSCGGLLTRDVTRGSGFVLKGEGWERDGYGIDRVEETSWCRHVDTETGSG